MAAPEVSVLLLTHNGAATLPRVLASIQAQVVPFPFEVVAVDSGSADGTLELLRNGADRLIEIREAEFNHGTTRNMGVEACRGPLVVLLVQDAEPASAEWLARLVEPLMAATPPRAALPRGVRWPARTAVRCPAQTPLPWHASIFPDTCRTVWRLMSRRLPAERHWTRSRLPSGWQPAPSTMSARASGATSGGSIRSGVSHCRGPGVGEDVMMAGYGLAFVPSATVVHSHDRPAAYELRRTYLVHQQLRRLFGLAAIPSCRAPRPCHRPVVRGAREVDPGRHGQRRRKAAPVAASAGAGRRDAAGSVPGARSADSGREFLRVRGV